MSDPRTDPAAGRPTVLIIEDEAEIRKFLKSTLAAHDFVPVEAENGRTGLRQWVLAPPDVVLLDLGLPDMEGTDLIREVREWSRTPIIVLSARTQEASKIEALEIGADDYLTKPFAAGELIARIRVALRHSRRAIATETAPYDYDGLVVDLDGRRVQIDGVDVHLTPIEFKLLSALVRHAGRVLTHSQLLKEIWGKHSLENNNYLRIHTQHLREKLKDDPLSPRFIITEPGIGYRLKQ